MTATPVRSFNGLDIYAARDGDHVTGRVAFPYTIHGRDSCPIDYRSTRPDQAPNQSRDRKGAAPGATGGVSASGRQSKRLEAVVRYRDLAKADPTVSQRRHLARVAAAFGVSPSSVRGWLTKFETQGPDALADSYVSTPTRVGSFTAQQAADAVLVCAWWSLRIGNTESIDTPMMHAAVQLLQTSGSPLADVIATIDAYYAYDCDRQRYPFKAFGRWAKYEFVKWLHRGASTADHHRAMAAAKARKRDVHNRPTRQGIRRLAESVAHPPPVGPNPQSPIPNPQPPIPNPQSPIPNSQSADVLHNARRLTALGHPDAARRHLAAEVPLPSGPPALAANQDPQTVAESLHLLDDGFRTMLLDAARGDRQALNQAYATMPVWWPKMPAALRRAIEFKLSAWIADHGRQGPGAMNRRRFLMFLPDLKPNRSGAQKLAVAMRLPQG